MNTTSASHPEAPRADAALPRVLVWDAPVRVFHWLMVLSFAGAWLSAESERWRLLHVSLGYTMLGLLAFRIVWGLVGTRHARFTSFVRGPAVVRRYLGALWRGDAAHSTGHNPAGALAIVAMLVLTAAVGLSGWASYDGLGGQWLEEAHEVAANLMLAVVGVHLAGVLLGSWLHHENLVGAMFSGRKPGRPDEAIRGAWRTVAVLMLVAVLGFWWLQWRSAPAGVGSSAAATSQGERHRGSDHERHD